MHNNYGNRDNGESSQCVSLQSAAEKLVLTALFKNESVLSRTKKLPDQQLINKVTLGA